MSAAPTQARLAFRARHRKLGATAMVRGHFELTELAGGKSQVSAEIAQNATSVLGEFAAGMSWQHSRLS